MDFRSCDVGGTARAAQTGSFVALSPASDTALVRHLVLGKEAALRVHLCLLGSVVRHRRRGCSASHPN